MTFPIIATIVSYYLFSAAVGAMSPPNPEQSRGFYGWLYRFLQRLAANADRIAQTEFKHLPSAGDALAAAAADNGNASVVATHERDTIVAVTGDSNKP